MLRSNQKQADNSVSKIKRDLEEINRSIVMKENSTVHIVDFQTPTEQWKQEVCRQNSNLSKIFVYSVKKYEKLLTQRV